MQKTSWQGRPSRDVARVVVVTCSLLLAACGGFGRRCGRPGAARGRQHLTVWDPYLQWDEASAWGKQVSACAADTGVTLKHSRFSLADLTAKTLLAVQQGNAPDVLIIDNTEVSSLAERGALASTAVTGADISGISPNVLAAGQVNGTAYGVPIGANTLGLFYNKKVLAAAGVDPASVKDWASLTAALAKVKAAGKIGITFSAVGTEEGSFQFLPWFWGGGANLRALGSPQAVAALRLWSSWVKRGYADKSVVNNTQDASWQEFLDGDVAFAENGTWRLNSARTSGLDWGVIPVPARAGGTAPAALGGEFVTMPVQKDPLRYARSKGMVSCLTHGEHAFATDSALSYVSVLPAVQQKQAAADPDLTVWVTAVSAAKGRTSDNLGSKYPRVSQLLSGAVQTAMSGAADVVTALSTAQAANARS